MVEFDTPEGVVKAVNGLDVRIGEGETLAIVGESGAGKTQLMLAVLGLLAENGQAHGEALYRGRDMMQMSPHELNGVRGSHIAMIFQDPMTSLNPYLTIEQQMVEVVMHHQGLKRDEARAHAIEMLRAVRIPDPEERIRQYPHEYSGGMRQRAMIAMAISNEPKLIIADEPTTALDVTVQAQILDIMRDLSGELEKTSIVLISHDMGVIAAMADRVQVMRDGEFVESGDVDQIFYSPGHAYTRMLLDAMPRIDHPTRPGHTVLAPPPAPETQTKLLDVADLRVHFPIRSAGWLPKFKPLRAVDGVSFSLHEGETLGIVGESGCGKSTLARAVLALLPKTEGTVLWCGEDLGRAGKEALRRKRKEFQIVFQDPLASLDPRMTIGQSIAEPLRALETDLDRTDITRRVAEMLEHVGLDPAWINRYPHEFSGGQNQRVGIARAMIVEPRLVVCDEAVSALDVSVQAQVIDLILSLQKTFGMSMIFISHDLSVVRQVSHRVMVLYLGRIVEIGRSDQLYENPQHPYTRALISAVPVPDPEAPGGRALLSGEIPSALSPPRGCAFHPRCPYAIDTCRTVLPEPRQVDDATVACHRADEPLLQPV